MIRQNLLFPLVVIAVSTTCLFADIAPDPIGAGVNPKPRKDTPDVAMTAEDVELVLSKQGLKVKVTFYLENLGPETTFEVGFPLNYKDELKDFTAEIDGKRTAPALKEQAHKANGKTYFKYWLVWEMSFAEKARKTVVVTYHVAPNKKPLEIRGSWSSEWEDRFGGEESFTKLNRLQTGYILETGAAWKGKIGRASVRLSLADGVTRDHIRALSPKPTRIEERTVTWEFTDLEPTENIRVEYNPNMALDEEIRAFRQAVEKDDSVELLLGLAELYDWKGDAAERIAAWDRLLNLVLKRVNGMLASRSGFEERSDMLEHAPILLEAIQNTVESPAAQLDAAAVKRRAVKAREVLERWIPVLETSDEPDADDTRKSARAALVKCRKALGQTVVDSEETPRAP
jgi:hypothetical protein